MKILTSAYRYFKYGRQIGQVHPNGSRLYSGNYFRKTGEKTKTLVGRDGTVLKTISNRRTGKDCFNCEYVETIPDSTQALITRTSYCNMPPYRYIHKDMFIGEKTSNGWALAKGDSKNFICSYTTYLKPSPLNKPFSS